MLQNKENTMERNTDLKASLIAEIRQKVKDRILEKSNADLLEKLINRADNINEAMAIAELGTMYEKTGLKFDVRLEKMSNDIKYFQKNENLSFHQDDTKPTHKLIIGDNYDALQNLLIEYKSKIDVIYIDPPYGKDSMGEFATTNYNNNITRDNLLSMLYPRLMLAKQLLSSEGVIFCSIDDKNQAYVKCLFDKVFGEKNFIANISCLSNPGGDKGDFIENTLQYILVYSKYRNSCISFGFWEIQQQKDYPLLDKYGNYKKGSQLEKWGAGDTARYSPNLAYSIYYNPQTQEVKCLFDYNRDDMIANKTQNIVYKEPNVTLLQKGFTCIRPRKTNTGDCGRWRLSEEEFKERLNISSFIFEKKDEGYKIYEKNRYEEKKFRKIKNFISQEIAQQTTAELRNIFGNKPFDFPKPIYLIEYIISLFTPSATILDFFAGSGTTGQAVLEMNREDNGNRTFILCQMDEKTEATPNGIATEVTAERLKRIMTGEGYKGEKDFKWLESNEPYKENLEVYDIKTVANFEQTEGKSAFDVIDETLYGQEKFQTLKEKVEWVANNFALTQMNLESKEDWQERQKGE